MSRRLRHFPGVRIPIPLVLLLCLAVVAGAWLYGTRDKDFLTPPSDAKLATVRARVKMSQPRADRPEAPVAIPNETKETAPPTPAEEPKPAIELGDLNSPPKLQEYSELEIKGASHLIDLAALLETEGEFQRALLAWERVIDTAKPDASQANTAVSAIKRLRPTLPDWNKEAPKAAKITIHAGTGKKNAKTVTSALEQTAKDIEHASSGLLKVTTSMTPGKDAKTANGPAPVAIWLSGNDKESVTTDVISFTSASPETLPRDLRQNLFVSVRGYLTRNTSHTPPPALANGADPLDGLTTHVTRLHWQALGTLLNRIKEKPVKVDTPAKPEKPAKPKKSH